MSFLSAIFGGGGTPAPVAESLPEPEMQRNEIDPNFDEQIAAAVKTRKALAGRTGRSKLVTGRGASTSGVSIVS